MKLSTRLQMKQSQSLVMTPQLVQSIKLLQLSSAELQEFVQAEIEKNPLLELDTSSDHSETGPSSGDPQSPGPETEKEPSSSGTDTITTELTIQAADNEQRLDATFENVYDSGNAGADHFTSGANNSRLGQSATLPRTNGGQVETDGDFLNQVGEKPDLQKYLQEQISCVFAEEADRLVATYIAYNLDDDGYFRDDLGEAAHLTGVDPNGFKDILKRFQTLEPTGIGARNLAECLTLQLIEMDRYDPAMRVMIENLDLMAKREFEKVKVKCGVSREDFNDMIRELKSLDPRPAARFVPVLSQTVVPDVVITQKQDGSWLIELNPETLPKVLVDREYYAELTSSIHSDEGRDFLSDCMSNAGWLERSLHQRAQTILKVAREIVKQQDAFFVHGSQFLKPMTLKKVAEAIKMHESTVSRVTSNKYLSCERGVFELKYFFSTAISSKSGTESVSAEAVKSQIRKMIESENSRSVHSDDQIVKNLQEAGIEIARRTVAKYREAMRIPSSIERRRQLKTLHDR